jgi:hypothetical protein
MEKYHLEDAKGNGLDIWAADLDDAIGYAKIASSPCDVFDVESGECIWLNPACIL